MAQGLIPQRSPWTQSEFVAALSALNYALNLGIIFVSFTSVPGGKRVQFSGMWQLQGPRKGKAGVRAVQCDGMQYGCVRATCKHCSGA